MSRKILDEINERGLSDYLLKFHKRKTTKDVAVGEIEGLALELLDAQDLISSMAQSIEEQKDDHAATEAAFASEIEGLRRDCRKTEEVADKYLNRFENERRAHHRTRERAGKALYEAVSFVGAPRVRDHP